MMPTLRRGLLLWALLAGGAYAVVLPTVRQWSWGPLVLTGLIALMIAWYTYGELTLAREPLAPHRADLAQWVAWMAELAGYRLSATSVVTPTDATDGEGEFTAPDSLPRHGEIVFDRGGLARHSDYVLLTQAARQMAAAQQPAADPPLGVLAVGLALGGILALRHALGAGVGASLQAMGLLVGVMVLIVWRTTDRTERQAEAVRQRANEILALLRQHHPEAFAQLAAEQGL